MAVCTCADPLAVSTAVTASGAAVSGAIASVGASALSQAMRTHEALIGRAMGGIDGAMAPVRFAHWAAPQITDIGESGWSAAFKAASIAIAIANSVAQAEIASKQQDLAESWYQHAKYKWDRFSANYLPLEKKLLLEVSTAPKEKLSCQLADSRAKSIIDYADMQTDSYRNRTTKSSRICVDDSLTSMLDIDKVLVYTDTNNYNLVDNKWFADFKNDQRWNRRSNVLNLGRNLSSEALKYGDIAKNVYGNVGARIETVATGAMQALGYYGAKNDTHYPSTFLSQNTSQVISIGANMSANAANTINPAT